MGFRTSLAAVAPWKFWKSTSATQLPVMPNYEDDLDERRPILHLDITSPLSLSEPTPTQLYGSTLIGEASGIESSPATHRNCLLRVLEEDAPEVGEDDQSSDDDDDDYELEEHGLYRGSYMRIATLYTLVPLASGFAFILLALLQVFAYPPQFPDSYPYPLNFPFPLPEFLASASLWSLSHLLRLPLHSILFFLSPSPTVATLLSTFFHTILHNLLRVAAFPLLLIHHHMVMSRPTWQDPSFRRIWWVALGWSFVEVAVGVAQGYEQISLYRDVLVPEGKDEEFFQHWQHDGSLAGPSYAPPENGSGSVLASSSMGARYEGKGKNSGSLPIDEYRTLSRNNGDSELRLPTQCILRSAPHVQVDRDLDYLMSLRGRGEVEEVYGIPAIRIPVFISCLLRLNSIILSLGLALILSASYLRSSMSRLLTFPSHSLNPVDLHQHVHDSHHLSTNRPFLITFPIVITLHLFLAFLHTPLVLPRIGVHTSAYVGLLVGLGCFFAGLGMWEALS